MWVFCPPPRNFWCCSSKNFIGETESIPDLESNTVVAGQKLMQDNWGKYIEKENKIKATWETHFCFLNGVLAWGSASQAPNTEEAQLFWPQRGAALLTRIVFHCLCVLPAPGAFASSSQVGKRKKRRGNVERAQCSSCPWGLALANSFLPTWLSNGVNCILLGGKTFVPGRLIKLTYCKCFNSVLSFTQVPRCRSESQLPLPPTWSQRGNGQPPWTQPTPSASALPTTQCPSGHTGSASSTCWRCAPTRSWRSWPGCSEMGSAKRTATHWGAPYSR